MRKNRRSNTKKERTIMIASSVFVLSALTMTGIYMKSVDTKEQGDGYVIDFTALESNVEDKYQEIAKNSQAGGGTVGGAETGIGRGAGIENWMEDGISGDLTGSIGGMEDDLDYPPVEAGSGLVKIPGLTDGMAEEPEGDPVAEKPEAFSGKKDAEVSNSAAQDVTQNAAPDVAQNAAPDAAQDAAQNAIPDAGQGQSADRAAASENIVGAEALPGTDGAAGPQLQFAEGEGLLRPVSGEVLIPFSMDSSVYFSTLDHFKYNPALMLSAETGVAVGACADGRVISVFEDEEIGRAITMELGDGYQITYGQLDGIRVAEGNLVEAGETIGFVAAPTKYFSVEGSNLYLKLTANGTPVDPEALLR